MIRSMTGFGRNEIKFHNGRITVEMKTVNHKFFDASIKLPPNMAVFEDSIKEELQKRINRGKVNLSIAYDGVLARAAKVVVDHKAARNYYEELCRLKKELGLKEEIRVADIMSQPGVVSYEASGAEAMKIWPKIKSALSGALTKLISDREKEGKALQADLLSRSRKIDQLLTIIKSRAHLNIDEYRKRFADRVKDLSGGNEINMGRLEMEVAIFAKNCDISEEITRLKNHLSHFNKTISTNGEVGKKIDFIAQELHRETNTIGSKASDFKVSKAVIDIKSEIEKIREQAKNLE